MIKKKIILGTQNIGYDINLNQSLEFLDFAFDNDLKVFDTAERYPFPESTKTFGLTEKIIGLWNLNSKKRNKVKIFTKVTGRNFGEISQVKSSRLTSQRIIKSAENSLKRLKTDYIDTFFLHWPDRFTNNFGREFYNPDNDIKYLPIENQLEALYQLKKSGKILNYGLSNETPWGLMTFYNHGIKKKIIPYIQEEYSILNRSIERSMKEIILREKLDFFAYSPLSGGLLTGKYHNQNPMNGRLNKHKKKSKRLRTLERFQMTKKLVKFCNSNSINPINLSLSFLAKQQIVKGIILGASSKKQLFDTLNLIKKPISSKIINKSLEVLY